MTGTRTASRLEKVRYARTRVAVVRGPNTGLVLEAAGRTLQVGTAPESDLVLTDDTVSRRHCEVRSAGDAWVVVDLGSTNGTRVNGNPVDGEQRLTHGGVVTIGATRLRFEVR